MARNFGSLEQFSRFLVPRIDTTVLLAIPCNIDVLLQVVRAEHQKLPSELRATADSSDRLSDSRPVGQSLASDRLSDRAWHSHF